MLKLLNFFTVVLLLTIQTVTSASENPVFEQLKDDMWEMGLDFNYTSYEHIVSPIREDLSPSRDKAMDQEELSGALYL